VRHVLETNDKLLLCSLHRDDLGCRLPLLRSGQSSTGQLERHLSKIIWGLSIIKMLLATSSPPCDRLAVLVVSVWICFCSYRRADSSLYTNLGWLVKTSFQTTHHSGIRIICMTSPSCLSTNCVCLRTMTDGLRETRLTQRAQRLQ
jgi:hypothetical protein